MVISATPSTIFQFLPTSSPMDSNTFKGMMPCNFQLEDTRRHCTGALEPKGTEEVCRTNQIHSITVWVSGKRLRLKRTWILHHTNRLFRFRHCVYQRPQKRKHRHTVKLYSALAVRQAWIVMNAPEALAGPAIFAPSIWGIVLVPSHSKLASIRASDRFGAMLWFFTVVFMF